MNDKVEGPNTRFSITDQEALQFHSRGRPGKLEIMPTKPMATQRDLSLAYSPGVAVPVKAIAAEVLFIQVQALDLGAHRAVNQQDALAGGAPQRR